MKTIKKSIVDRLAGSLKRYVPASKLNTPWEVVVKETHKARVKMYTKINSEF